MSIRVNDDVIEQIKESIDIVNLISDYIPLKKSGTNYVGLCPFHNEKTPSFTVSEEKDFFHCFGCGEGGDGVTFVMKKENLDFPHALKFLADKYGISIDENPIDDKVLEEKNRAYEMNRDAARFFHDNLTKNPRALAYLEKRKINPKVIRQFGLGFAMDSWDNLYNFLKLKGYKEEELEKVGLIGKKTGNNGYYDRFRNRIIFPIIDTKSRVVGFGGRVLDNTMPKYLNSQDTIVFNKGNHLYGLNLLNKFSTRKKILLVEGYMDVISLYTRGINYSVSSLGTALTDRQSKLIRRYGEEVYICYDSDLAGIKATFKAIDILLNEGVNPKIILLPNGMDPDDYINKTSLLDFEKLFVNYLSHIDFKILINKRKYNLNKAEDKIAFTIEISKTIKTLKSPIEQDVYIDKVSKDMNISKEAIEKEVRGNNYSNRYNNKKDISYNKPKEKIYPVNMKIVSGNIKAEIDLIKLMIEDKDYYESIIERVNIEDFINYECKQLGNLIISEYSTVDKIKEDELFGKATNIENINIDILKSIKNSELNFQPTNMDQIIIDLTNNLVLNKLELKRNDMINKIGKLDKQIDKNDEENTLLMNLCRELPNINKEIKLIKNE